MTKNKITLKDNDINLFNDFMSLFKSYFAGDITYSPPKRIIYVLHHMIYNSYYVDRRTKFYKKIINIIDKYYSPKRNIYMSDIYVTDKKYVKVKNKSKNKSCLLYTSPSPRDS